VRLVHPTPEADAIAVARRIHASTYALLLWKFRLKSCRPHGKPFVEEIASDAYRFSRR